MLGGALSSSVQCLASSGPAQEGLCGLWGSRVLSAVRILCVVALPVEAMVLTWGQLQPEGVLPASVG